MEYENNFKSHFSQQLGTSSTSKEPPQQKWQRSSQTYHINYDTTVMCIHFGISVNTILSNITQINNVKAIILVLAKKILLDVQQDNRVYAKLVYDG